MQARPVDRFKQTVLNGLLAARVPITNLGPSWLSHEQGPARTDIVNLGQLFTNGR